MGCGTKAKKKHQADFKELAVIKADGVVAFHLLLLDQTFALEHTTQTTAMCSAPA